MIYRECQRVQLEVVTIFNLVIDISNILNKSHTEPKVIFHDPPQDIRGDIVSCMPKMASIVNSWATAIPCNILPTFIKRNEWGFGPGQRIVQLERWETISRREGLSPGRLLAGCGGGGHATGTGNQRRTSQGEESDRGCGMMLQEKSGRVSYRPCMTTIIDGDTGQTEEADVGYGTAGCHAGLSQV